MNKAELIDKIAEDAEISKKQAAAALDSFTEAIAKTLKKGDKDYPGRFWYLFSV